MCLILFSYERTNCFCMTFNCSWTGRVMPLPTQWVAPLTNPSLQRSSIVTADSNVYNSPDRPFSKWVEPVCWYPCTEKKHTQKLHLCNLNTSTMIVFFYVCVFLFLVSMCLNPDDEYYYLKQKVRSCLKHLCSEGFIWQIIVYENYLL